MTRSKVKFGEAEQGPEAQDVLEWGHGVGPAEIGSIGGFTLYRCRGYERQPGDYNILFSAKAYRDVMRHLEKDTTREQGTSSAKPQHRRIV